LHNKVSRKERYIFASGDLFGGGAQIIINFYFLIFLTDVVRIRPALAGIIILAAQIWDAVSDPMMGLITDRTRSRWGRRRPYFLIGFFGILAAFFLIWYPISNENEWVRFFYMLFAYVLYKTVSTIVMVPYSAMSSEISIDFKERTLVNGTRLVFSQAASLICAVAPIEIVKAFPDIRTGYMVMALAFALFFAVPYLLIFLFAKERVTVEEQAEEKWSLTEFIKPFRVRIFRSLLFIYLFSFLAMDIVSTIFAYYMNYYLKRPSELNYVLGALLITQLVCVPLVIKAAYRIGKSGVIKNSVFLWMSAILFMALLQPNWPNWVIYFTAVYMGLGIAGCVVMPWIMFPDVTDVGELAFNRRNAGSFSGIMTLSRKTSSAIGIFIVSIILEIAGYIEPKTIIEDGITKTVMMEQPASLILALKIIILVIPFVLLCITWFAARGYTLEQKTSEKITQYLEYKRGNASENPVSPEELETLKKMLI
jgi:oligogalacturonide transporter